MQRRRTRILLTGAATLLLALAGLYLAGLRDLAGTLAILAVSIVGIGLLAVGLVRLVRPATRQRADIRLACLLAGGLGVLVAIIAELVFVGLMGFDVGVQPEFYAQALPWALAVGATIGVMVLASYGLVSSLVRDGGSAPFVAIGVLVVALTVGYGVVTAANAVRSQAALDDAYRANEEFWQRSAVLHGEVTVADVLYEGRADGTSGADGLTLDLVLSADQATALRPATPHAPWSVSASADELLSCTLWGTVSSGTPATVGPEPAPVVRLVLTSPCSDSPDRPEIQQPGPPGRWTVFIDVVRGDGAPMQLRLPFEVPANGA